jgi:hypothetical protein
VDTLAGLELVGLGEARLGSWEAAWGNWIKGTEG